MVAPAGLVSVMVPTPTPVTASLKVAVALVPTATFTASAAGVRPVTVGATPAVVKDQVVAASLLPLGSPIVLASVTV